jgi:hypothetical protein
MTPIILIRKNQSIKDAPKTTKIKEILTVGAEKGISAIRHSIRTLKLSTTAKTQQALSRHNITLEEVGADQERYEVIQSEIAYKIDALNKLDCTIMISHPQQR